MEDRFAWKTADARKMEEMANHYKDKREDHFLGKTAHARLLRFRIGLFGPQHFHYVAF